MTAGGTVPATIATGFLATDLVVLNNIDLLDPAAVERLRVDVAYTVPRAVKPVPTRQGRLDPAVLLEIGAAAEDGVAARTSHHDDAEDGAHEHDDFESFAGELPDLDAPESLPKRPCSIRAARDILRIKGFAALPGDPLRLAVQGVGGRFRPHFDQPWGDGTPSVGHRVAIGRAGLDRIEIGAMIRGSNPARKA